MRGMSGHINFCVISKGFANMQRSAVFWFLKATARAAAAPRAYDVAPAAAAGA